MKSSNSIQEDEIDLVALLASIYQKRRFILKSVLIFMVLGLIVAIISPKVYKAQAVFVVQNSDKQISSSISSFAALAGVNLQSESMGDIPALLYPNIVSGVPFNLDLLKTPLDSNKLNYRDHLLQNKSSLISLIKKYTIGLPSHISSSFKSKNQTNIEFTSDIFQISEIDYKLIKNMNELISVEVNKKEGLISLSAMDPNPKYAAIIANRALELLQNFIFDYKTENAKRIFKFISEQYDSKQKQYYEIQKELAEFKDQNKNISTAVFQSNLQKIQTRYDIVYSVYLELSKQLEQAKIQVKKQVPNISIIEPVFIPNEKEKPKRFLILVIYSFLGLVLSIGWVLISRPVYDILKTIRD